MSSIAAVVGTDLWQAEVYGALSAASRLSASVKQGLSTVQLGAKLWSFDRLLKKSFETIYYQIEHPDASPAPFDRAVALVSVVELRKLYGTVQTIYSRAKDRGLTNRSLTNSSLTSIVHRSEQFLELADWIEDVLTDNTIDEKFDRSLDEFKRGEVFDLPRLK